MPDALLLRLRPAALKRRAGNWVPRIRGRLALWLGGPGRWLTSRLARWRPRAGGRREGTRAFGPLTLLSRQPAPRMRTVIRSERLSSRLHALALRRTETLTRSVVVPPRVAPNGTPPGRRLSRSGAAVRPDPRTVSVPSAGYARHTTRRETWLLPLALRERIERTSLGSTTRSERILARPGPAGAGPLPAPRRTAPAPTLVHAPRPRREVARPGRAPEPAHVTTPREGRAATPAPPPEQPGPPLDELVDRVLRRIERRAIAQRERLGRA